MGFRNPFRIQVDENDVAYISDYSPDANTQQRSRGPSGTGRYEIVRKPSNYGWPTCYKRDLAYYQWNFHEFAPNTTTAGTPLNNPPRAARRATAPTPAQRLAVEPRGRPVGRARPRRRAAGHQPGHLVLVPRQQRHDAARHAVPGATTRRRRGRSRRVRPPSARGCSPSSTRAASARTASTKYNYDPANPNPKKFPPYYDDSVIIGEWTQDTMREVKLDEQNRVFKINGFLDCGSRANTAAGTFLFECDNPMDMQWGADGAFYLLTYGNGFNVISPDAGMYKWEYVKGKRAPKAVLTTDKTDGASPLTVNFSSAGSLDEDPGDSIRFEWDFGDGSPISTEPNPTHTYTQRGRFTAVLTRVRLLGREDVDEHDHHRRATPARRSPSRRRCDGGLFSFGDELEYKVTVTDPEDPTINCGDVRSRSCSATTRTAMSCRARTGCRGFLQTDANDASHGGNVFGVISATLHGQGRHGRRAAADDDQPGPDAPEAPGGRARRHPVGHATRPPTPTAAPASHRSSLGQRRLDAAQRPVQPVPDRLGDVPRRGQRRRQAARAGSPLAAIEVRTGSQTGPIVDDAQPDSTGGTAVWSTARRSRSRWRASTSCSSCSAR